MEGKLNTENQELEVFVNDSSITVLKGDAPKPVESRNAEYTGNIDSVYNVLHNDALYNVQDSMIVVDSASKKIEFYSNIVDSSHGLRITAKMIPNAELDQMKINTEKRFTLNELKSLIKKSRILFVDKDLHFKLIDSLSNFKAKVEKDIQDGNDQKGNVNQQYIQKLQLDFDLSFVVSCPIYVGNEPSTFKVEIMVDVRDKSVEFYLESVELYELSTEIANQALKHEATRLYELGYTKIIYK